MAQVDGLLIPDYDIGDKYLWHKFDLAFWPELRLLACYVSLLANRWVLYHIFSENQVKSVLNLQDSPLFI